MVVRNSTNKPWVIILRLIFLFLLAVTGITGLIWGAILLDTVHPGFLYLFIGFAVYRLYCVIHERWTKSGKLDV